MGIRDIYVTDSMIVGRTTGTPKSALRYELDKVRYPDLETSLVLPELKKVGIELNSLLLQHEILEKLVTYMRSNCGASCLLRPGRRNRRVPQ